MSDRLEGNVMCIAGDRFWRQTLRLCAAAMLLCAAAEPLAARTNTVVVATWNVENLFDSSDDPANAGDDEFTPRGKMYWSYPRYRQKLTNLAEVVAAMQPDILCLQEVENRRVLSDLAFVTEHAFGWQLPVIVHREGGDMRGIDVAILSRHEPSQVAWLSSGFGRRDQLVAAFDIGGRELTVFCNHWKSWSGDIAENTRTRTREARALAREVRRRLKAAPAAALLATGDFNDQVDSDILTKEAGFVLWPSAATPDLRKALLFNLSGLLPADARGTYYYSKNRVWNTFDSMSVSSGMLPGAAEPAPWQAATNTYGRFIGDTQTNAAGWPLSYWRALRTETGRRKVGVSDHFPVRVELRPAGAAAPVPPPDDTTPSWGTRLWRQVRRVFP